MTKINYKSDFDFIANLKAVGADGTEVEIGFPSYDFEAVLTTDCSGYNKHYVASQKNGVTTNCFNDNGKLHIICDNHKLSVGELKLTFNAYLPNNIYPDGSQKVVADYDMNIELVVENTDVNSAEVDVLLPFFYDSAYRQAVIAGYKGTQEEYFALASQLPNAVETANKVQASADSLANSAEQIGDAIETLGATTEAIEQGANVIKDNADKVSESATKVEQAIEQGANVIKDNADKVSESATKVEQAVEPLVQASESLDATKQAFEMLSSEWADGRQAIATALTNRRYPTEPSESFHAMAEKVENMSYEEGWFAKIGYTDENDGGIKDAIDYSYELAKGWNPDGSTSQMFRESGIVFFPFVDVTQLTNAQYICQSCKRLVSVPRLPLYINRSLFHAFEGCSNLTRLELFCDNTTIFSYLCYNSSNMRELYLSSTANGTSFDYFVTGAPLIEKIVGLDFSLITNTNTTFGNNHTALVSMCIKNIGKSSLTTFKFSGLLSWGMGSEENRQSLIDSLITYSYDRASAGMTTATIQLSSNTKALLTEDEIAQITAKGFTIA